MRPLCFHSSKWLGRWKGCFTQVSKQSPQDKGIFAVLLRVSPCGTGILTQTYTSSIADTGLNWSVKADQAPERGRGFDVCSRCHQSLFPPYHCPVPPTRPHPVPPQMALPVPLVLWLSTDMWKAAPSLPAHANGGCFVAVMKQLALRQPMLHQHPSQLELCC